LNAQIGIQFISSAGKRQLLPEPAVFG